MVQVGISIFRSGFLTLVMVAYSEESTIGYGRYSERKINGSSVLGLKVKSSLHLKSG